MALAKPLSTKELARLFNIKRARRPHNPPSPPPPPTRARRPPPPPPSSARVPLDDYWDEIVSQRGEVDETDVDTWQRADPDSANEEAERQWSVDPPTSEEWHPKSSLIRRLITPLASRSRDGSQRSEQHSDAARVGSNATDGASGNVSQGDDGLRGEEWHPGDPVVLPPGIFTRPGISTRETPQPEYADLDFDDGNEADGLDDSWESWESAGGRSLFWGGLPSQLG